MKKTVFALVDCDNFFVSCERVFRPDLWRKPVTVLSNNDGCIVARSNEVKAMGIPMGIPYFKVKDDLKKNDVSIFSANFSLYGDFSQRVVEILKGVSAHIEVYSVDESFLEIGDQSIEDYTKWAQELHAAVWQWVGIPVSIGVAPTKTLAKAAAEKAKHQPELGGAYSLVVDVTLSPEAAEQRRVGMLKEMSIESVWGIGRRLAPVLRDRGIATAFAFSETSEKWAEKTLSVRGLYTLKELKGEQCLRIEDSAKPQQQLAVTRTFPHSLRAWNELEARFASYTAKAAQRLREHRQIAGAVLVFIAGDKHRDEVYRRVSTVASLLEATSDTATLMHAVLQGLEELYDPDFSYRRGGVVLLDLASEEVKQLSWLVKNDPHLHERQKSLMHAVDSLNSKYYTRLVWHAAEQQNQQQDWRKKTAETSRRYTTSWQELPTVS